MSRQLDFTQPLSPEDRAYAEQFPMLHGQMIQVNEEIHGRPADARDETLDGDDDEVVPYSKWSPAELKAEAARRNKEEGTSLPTDGRKADLVAALELDDEARPQA